MFVTPEFGHLLTAFDFCFLKNPVLPVWSQKYIDMIKGSRDTDGGGFCSFSTHI